MRRPSLKFDTLLQSIVDSTGSAIVMIDARGTVLSFSPAGETMFGYAHEEIEGRNVSMLMTEEHRAHHDSYIARYLQTGEPHIIGRSRMLPAQHKSGRRFPVRLAVGTFQHNGDTLFVGILEDLTQLDQTRERLRAAERKLELQLQKTTMAVLCSSIAHELNQPLTGATSRLEAIDLMLEKERRPVSDPVRRTLREAIDEVEWAGSVLRQARRLAKSGEPDRHPFDVNALVHEALVLARQEVAREDAIELSTRFADGLPPVSVDRTQMQQVIINLVRNAADAIRTGGGSIVAETGLQDGWVTVSVSDDGPGIASEVANTIFDAFVTTKYDGLGLGLAVSKLLIEAHGGTIDARPNTPRGTTVTVRLPPDPVQ